MPTVGNPNINNHLHRTLGKEKSAHMFTNDFYAQNLVVKDNDKENINNGNFNRLSNQQSAPQLSNTAHG